MLVFDPVDDLHLQAISEQRRGIAKIWGSLGQGECCGNLCMLVISSFNMIHASFFLWVVTSEGVKSILQPNDKQSANMQVYTPQS